MISEHSEKVSEYPAKAIYYVGLDKNGTHSTFGFLKDDFNYDNLKSIIIKILQKEINPGASSSKGKK
ncbi:MAG: hypothetical protein ABI295_04845 [Xanthomarina sp.]